jgi:hypothetical protein
MQLIIGFFQFSEKSKIGMSTIRPEISTIMEESSILETSKRSRRSDDPIPEAPTPKTPRHSSSAHEQHPNVSDIFGQSVLEPHIDLPEVPSLIHPHYEDDGPPSIAPFSVGPASVGPPSVGPIVSCFLSYIMILFIL